jgi:glutathione S-transferase
VLKLCGFKVSNYYRKVKLALLEKGIAFEEVHVYPSQDEALLERSPLGKIPFIEADGVAISESQVIIEYLEDAYPVPPLYPSDPAERAKCRELIQFVELHIELPARWLYPEAIFGRKVSAEIKTKTEARLERGLKALERIAKFEPYIAGNAFTYADCAALVHLPLVGWVTKFIYKRDFLDTLPGFRDYMEFAGKRPHYQHLLAERKSELSNFVAWGHRNASYP